MGRGGESTVEKLKLFINKSDMNTHSTILSNQPTNQPTKQLFIIIKVQQKTATTTKMKNFNCYLLLQTKNGTQKPQNHYQTKKPCVSRYMRWTDGRTTVHDTTTERSATK